VSDLTKKIYFNRARTALKFGLYVLDIKPDEEILVPDYMCDSIFQPISQTSLKYSVYKTQDNLEPLWASLDSLITSKTKAILMVHYFGQVQDINKFLEFSKKHEIYLIEDNAHGHGGMFNDRELGTFGDIGISSPRKFLNCLDGGILYLNKSYNTDHFQNMEYSLEELKRPLIKKILDNFPNTKSQLRKLFTERPKYEVPRIFSEPYVEDLYLHPKISKKIDSMDWNEIRKNRREVYNKLESKVLASGLHPIFKSLSPQSNPWCLPAYTKNQKESIDWFDWGWKNNIEVYSWPVLREDQIEEDNEAFQKWKKIICFSTGN